MAIEGNRFMCSLVGVGNDPAPTDYAGFVECSKQLSHPMIHEMLTQLRPLGEGKIYRVPMTRIRHFDELGAAFPANLLVMGDAFCFVNPVFAQGMSVSLKCSQTLRACLAT